MKKKVAVAICITVVLWASAFVGIRGALRDYGPIQLAVFRYLGASVVLIPIALANRIRLPRRRDLPLLILTGFFGFTLYNIVLNLGETMITASAACFIVNTNSLITALIATLFFHETIKPRAWFGMLISLAGVALVSLGESHQGLAVNWGTGFVLLAAVAQSVFFILQKKLLQRYSGLETVCYTMWLGALLLLPWGKGLPGAIRHAAATSTLSVIYLGIFPSVVAYFCWAYVLSKLRVAKATVFLYFVPIATMVLSYFWLGEVPGGLSIGGGLMIITGVWLVNRREKPENAMEEAHDHRAGIRNASE